MQQVVQNPVWSDRWLTALTGSAVLAGLLWRLGDSLGTSVAMWISMICVAAIVASAAIESVARHLRIVQVDEDVSSN